LCVSITAFLKAGDSKEPKSTRSNQSLSAPNYIAEEDGDDEEVDEEDGGVGEGETLKAGIRAEMDLWLGEAEKEFGVASGSAKVAEFVARLLCERLPALIAVRAPPHPTPVKHEHTLALCFCSAWPPLDSRLKNLACCLGRSTGPLAIPPASSGTRLSRLSAPRSCRARRYLYLNLHLYVCMYVFLFLSLSVYLCMQKSPTIQSNRRRHSPAPVFLYASFIMRLLIRLFCFCFCISCLLNAVLLSVSLSLPLPPPLTLPP